jgi:hypothetical protein
VIGALAAGTWERGEKYGQHRYRSPNSGHPVCRWIGLPHPTPSQEGRIAGAGAAKFREMKFAVPRRNRNQVMQMLRGSAYVGAANRAIHLVEHLRPFKFTADSDRVRWDDALRPMMILLIR